MSDLATTKRAVAVKNLAAHVDEAMLWLLFALVGGVGASVLAMGLLLRSDKRLTARMVVGTVLHSLAWGVATFLLMVDQSAMSVPVMLAVSIFSGMGVASFVDVLVMILRRQLGFVPPPPAPSIDLKEPH